MKTDSRSKIRGLWTGSLVLAATAATAAGQSVTLTTCDEFAGGTFDATVCTGDAIKLSSQSTTLPVLWVANAGEDTVSKWNTTTNREEARYRTWFGPNAVTGAFGGPAPSRTAVDRNGNVYVANRHFDGRPASVLKILNEGFIDRNGNGVMDTSMDVTGDGQIQINNASEMFILSDVNGNGLLDNAELLDERVAWVAQAGTSNALGRCLAVDSNDDVWLGLYSTRQL